MSISENLDVSAGSVTGPTRLGRKIISSKESDEEARSSAANTSEIKAPSLVDEPFDETAVPAEVKIEEEDLMFFPTEAKRQLERLIGSQGAGPSSR